MTRVVVPPVLVELDGAKVYILEITKHEWVNKQKRFLVTVFVEWNGFRSPIFTLDVESNAELKAKLRAEIAKMKFIIMSGKHDIYKRIE